MSSLANINIRFSADLADFSKKMQTSLREIDKWGQKLQNVGAGLTVGVTTPIVAFGVASVLAFDQSAQAIAQVDAALKSTGGTVGYNSEQLQKMAADLQSVTTFDDDEILKKATANLLTFSKITGTTFQDAQKAALDLATRLDGDLQSASIQVGKALNDPIKGISALSRVGVSFSEGQKAMIQSMVDTNNLAGAQAIILAELQKEFGGSAEAAAKAGLGGFKQLGNMLGDLSEDFGKIILEAIQPFLESIKSMVSYLKELTPEAKMTIAVVAGIAAAIGPLTLGIGVVLSMLPTLIAGFTALTGPIGLTVLGLTAVAVVIVKNWAPIKKILVDVANYFVDLYNNSTLFRGAVEYIGMTFKNMWAVIKLTFNNIIATVTFVGQHIYNIFKTAGSLIKSVLTLDIDGIKKSLSSGFSQLGTDAVAFFRKLADNGKNTAKEVSGNVLTALNNTIKGNKIAKIVIPVEVKKAKTSEVPGEPQSPDNPQVPVKGKKTETTVRLSKPQLPTEVDFEPQKLNINYYEEQIKRYRELQDEFGTATEEGRAKYQMYADKISSTEIIIQDIQGKDKLKDSTVEITSTLLDLNDMVSGAVEGLAENAAVGLGEAIGGIISGTASLGSVLGGMLSMVADFMKQLGKQMIQVGIASIALKKVWLEGPLAIAAGIALIALASIAQNTMQEGPKRQAFANGGIVGGASFYGDKILARVNSGELILNNKQQKAVYGAMNSAVNASDVAVQILGNFDVSGDQIRLVLARADKRKSRTS